MSRKNFFYDAEEREREGCREKEKFVLRTKKILYNGTALHDQRMVSKSLDLCYTLHPRTDTYMFCLVLSANEEMETMMKGIKHGAYDYLVKPVHLDQIKNIWLHVVKKGKSDPRNYVRGGADNDAVQKNQSGDATTDKNDAADDTRNCSRKNKKDGDDPEDDGEKPYSSAQKRPRIQWSAQLHRKFVDVVHYIGIDSKLSLFMHGFVTNTVLCSFVLF
jgi:CheY-like chemotaxis protein